MADPQSGLTVFGASSLVGRFLLMRLEADGRPYRAVSRNGSDDPKWLANDLERLSPATLPPAAGVISLAPIWVLPASLPALREAGLRRLVAVSSTSRFTKAESSDSAERAVASSLGAAEEAVSAFCDAHGIAWTILRPTLIYSEGRDENVSRLARLIRRAGVLPLSGSGAGRRQPVHADDVAAGALAAFDAAGAAGRAFDLPGGETLSYRAMCVRIFQALGRPPLLLSLPPPVWRAAFRLAKPLLPGAGAAMGERMAEDLVFDGGPAREAFDWAPRAFRPVFD